jgi:hypothetical protein
MHKGLQTSKGRSQLQQLPCALVVGLCSSRCTGTARAEGRGCDQRPDGGLTVADYQTSTAKAVCKRILRWLRLLCTFVNLAEGGSTPADSC